METGNVQAVPRSAWQESLAGDLFRDICCETSSGRTFPKWRLWIWNRPRLHMLVLECRSFVRRIQMLLTNTHSYELPTEYLFVQVSSGQTVLNIRALARIRDIKTLASSRRWASPAEMKGLHLSWELGFLWGACIGCS